MHMDGVVMRKLWVVLFILTAIVGSEAGGGKLENGTANSTHNEQGNTGSSFLAVAEIPSAGIGEVRNKTTSYTTEVDINNKKKQPNWMSRGRGGGGGYAWGWGGGGGGGGGGKGGGAGGGGGGW
ncbi:glycine-rich RNA-binding protein 2, mitochondrial-like [Pyrus x bretschneideri]|uniref:glycine-rich RNA-binding protein 2, mitochondrial-like n=1 Tax=Pyrus x bretschneideri TaxID=225117 RepID=UPI00202DBA71|nr:glycine-rich RNA-binding protein 2, mitochondrial-like [Pyrus x bretschneideri]